MESSSVVTIDDLGEGLGPSHGFFIKSTGPLNVDSLEKAPSGKKEVPGETDADKVAAIAGRILDFQNEGILPLRVGIQVHGFSNSAKAGEDQTRVAWEEIRTSQAPGLIYLPYCWPSEPLGLPIVTLWRARTNLMWTFFLIAALLIAFGFARDQVWATVLGLLIYALPLATGLLRALSYYRDSYRAQHYGVMDLMQVIRELDNQLKGQVPPNSIELSFVGHSMGAFVVTNLVRILTDVFDVLSIPSNQTRPSSHVGNVFDLCNLVLASPDIPTEAALSGRRNFLQSSLRRFKECFLLTNEGDVVLAMIGTTAQSFAYPSIRRERNSRLGHLCFDKPKAGLHIAKDLPTYLHTLFSGFHRLDKLRGELAHEDQAKLEPDWAGRFTVIDCTDFRDEKGKRGMSLFRPPRQTFSVGQLVLLFPFYIPLTLLKLAPDVHSGYFKNRITRQIIGLLAVSGYSGLAFLAYKRSTELDPSREAKGAVKDEDIDAYAKAYGLCILRPDRTVREPVMQPAPKEPLRTFTLAEPPSPEEGFAMAEPAEEATVAVDEEEPQVT